MAIFTINLIAFAGFATILGEQVVDLFKYRFNSISRE